MARDFDAPAEQGNSVRDACVMARSGDHANGLGVLKSKREEDNSGDQGLRGRNEGVGAEVDALETQWFNKHSPSATTKTYRDLYDFEQLLRFAVQR